MVSLKCHKYYSNVVSDSFPPIDEIVVSIELSDDHVLLLSDYSV